MSPTKSLVALTAALGLLGSAGIAFAQTSSTCATDTDCQHGYTCQVTAIVYGTTPACPPDAPCATAGTGGSTGGTPRDATDGGTAVPTGGSGTAPTAGAGGSATSGDLPAKDGGTSDPGSTITSTISSCVPGPCTADSDCAAGMICHGQTVTTCTGGSAVPPCEAGTKCDSSGVVTESQCTTETVSTCAFRWELPCNADTDCGDGFFCQPSVGGSCSSGAPGSGVGGETGGSTGAGNTGGGTSGSGTTGSATPGNSGSSDLPADTCTTTMTYPGYCRSLVAACNVDADCPSPWICQDNTVSVGGAGGATVAPAADGGTASTSSGGAASGSAADVAPPLNTKMCVAPYTPVGVKDGGAGGRTGGGSTSAPSGAGGGGTPPQGANDGSGPTGGTGGTLSPTTSAAGTGGSTGTHESGAPASADNSGGCAVIPSGRSSSAGLLALAGLAMLVARRRRS